MWPLLRPLRHFKKIVVGIWAAVSQAANPRPRPAELLLPLQIVSYFLQSLAMPRDDLSPRIMVCCMRVLDQIAASSSFRFTLRVLRK